MLRVLKVSEDELVVDPTTPFRILHNPNEQNAQTVAASGIQWSLWNYTLDQNGAPTFVEVVGITGVFTKGSVHTERLPDRHIIPLVTFTGSGFFFHPGGGSVEATGAAVNSDDLQSLQLPFRSVESLADSTGADAGANLVGADQQSAVNHGGAGLAAGTVDSQIEGLLDLIAYQGVRTRTLTFNATEATIAAGPTSTSARIYISNWMSELGINNASNKRLVVVGADLYLEESFEVLRTVGNDSGIGVDNVGRWLTMDAGIGLQTASHQQELFKDVLVSDPELVGKYTASLTGTHDEGASDVGHITGWAPSGNEDLCLTLRLHNEGSGTGDVAGGRLDFNLGLLSAGRARLVVRFVITDRIHLSGPHASTSLAVTVADQGTGTAGTFLVP